MDDKSEGQVVLVGEEKIKERKRKEFLIVHAGIALRPSNSAVDAEAKFYLD